jgi:hypothetical protein
VDDQEMIRAKDRARARTRAGWRTVTGAVVSLACGLAILGVQAAEADVMPNPIGVHSMLQLNDPPSFMQTMFAEAAAVHVSSIRLDVAPAPIYTDPSHGDGHRAVITDHSTSAVHRRATRDPSRSRPQPG